MERGNEFEDHFVDGLEHLEEGDQDEIQVLYQVGPLQKFEDYQFVS